MLKPQKRLAIVQQAVVLPQFCGRSTESLIHLPPLQTMKTINILTIGSRGDVQPYLALGVGLKRAGYQVRLTTHDTFKDLIKSYGLDFFPIGGNVQAIVQGEAGQATIESGRNPFKALSCLAQALAPIMVESLDNTWKSCQDADLVISSGTAFWGDDAAARLGIPSVVAMLQPLLKNHAFPHPMLPPRSLGGWGNGLTYEFFNRFYWQLFKAPINHWRQKTLQMPPSNACPFLSDRWRTLPKLFGYSPTVIPHPPAWDDSYHVTGYWFLDAPDNFTPPATLQDFLADGEPPISIGFGSMATRNPEELTAIALAALEKTKQRGILLTGWSGISNADLPDHILKLEGIPHDWLFPRMKAIVHHGGAGTTAAAFRSGRPAVIVPFFADQPFWGDRAAQLGVSPKPIPKQRLSAERLARGIEDAIANPTIQQRANHLGTIIQSENGIAQAQQIIERVIKKETYYGSCIK